MAASDPLQTLTHLVTFSRRLGLRRMVIGMRAVLFPVVLAIIALAGCDEEGARAQTVCTASNLSYGQEADLRFYLMTDGSGNNGAALDDCPDVIMHPFLTNVPEGERRAFWQNIRETIAKQFPLGIGSFDVVARGHVEPQTGDDVAPKIIIRTIVSVRPVAATPGGSVAIS